MWFSGFTLADTSNKIGVAVSGVTGVTGAVMAGWSHIFLAIDTTLSGHAVGVGMPLFTIGLIAVAAVWTMNGLFTANHEPIL